MPDHEHTNQDDLMDRATRALRDVHVPAGPPDEVSDRLAARMSTGGWTGQPWWSRRIPVWQAAAACVVVCLLTALTGRAGDGPSPRQATSTSPSATFVRVDPAIFGVSNEPVYRTDVTRWRVIDGLSDNGTDGNAKGERS